MATATIRWEKPDRNTDASALLDFKSFLVEYGTVSGVYPYSIDLFAKATGRGVTEIDIPNLIADVNYYVVVTAYDASGNNSLKSSEFKLVAQDSITPEPEDFIDIVSLPTTITTPGSYRVIGSHIVESGAGITINSSGVRLFGGNRLFGSVASNTITYSETSAGQGIVLGNGVYDIDIFGLDFIRGAAAHTSIIGGSAIAGSSIGSGVRVWSCHFNSNKSYSLGIYISTDASDLEVFQCECAISNGSVNCAFTNIKSTTRRHRVYNNITTQAATSGYVGAFHFPARGEYYLNTSIIDATVYQGFVFQSWGNDDNYIHDNTITSYAEQARMINPDGGSSYWTIVHNKFNMLYSGVLGTSRTISMRYGSNNHAIGYNIIDGALSTNTRGIRFGGDDASWSGAVASNVNVYENNITVSDVALELDGGGGDGLHSWNNHYESASLAISSSANIPVSNVAFNADTVVGGINQLNSTGIVNWYVYNSFLPVNVNGDTSAMVFGATPNDPVYNVPNPPSNLRSNQFTTLTLLVMLTPAAHTLLDLREAMRYKQGDIINVISRSQVTESCSSGRLGFIHVTDIPSGIGVSGIHDRLTVCRYREDIAGEFVMIRSRGWNVDIKALPVSSKTALSTFKECCLSWKVFKNFLRKKTVIDELNSSFDALAISTDADIA